MSTSESTANEGLSARLQKVTAELRELEQAMQSGNIDPRLLGEFRQAVDNVRRTAWVVQQWVRLEEQHRDTYTLLPRLTAERVRRATQLSNDLALDVDAAEVTIVTEGVADLSRAVKGLYKRLAQFAGDKEGQ